MKPLVGGSTYYPLANISLEVNINPLLLQMKTGSVLGFAVGRSTRALHRKGSANYTVSHKPVSTMKGTVKMHRTVEELEPLLPTEFGRLVRAKCAFHAHATSITSRARSDPSFVGFSNEHKGVRRVRGAANVDGRFEINTCTQRTWRTTLRGVRKRHVRGGMAETDEHGRFVVNAR
ncbi:hypothetical protein RR48_01283 [Papilio machaon]|uniref:Uncharacterized protein n=1 Tax=Papilio machaon TaxID=76193 RepID=A0A0N1PI71_PAPMA|nr:hypothetical protein RR48_01283 [Papilio machaon]